MFTWNIYTSYPVRGARLMQVQAKTKQAALLLAWEKCRRYLFIAELAREA